MRLIQLQYFVEIVRQQSFTRAAEKLYVSQPALSKSVRMLEQEFKVDLINRTEKGFVLTKNGQLFFDYAQRILETVELQTHELNQRLHGLEGSLRIGIPPTSGTIYYHSLISHFCEAYPNIDLHILEVPSRTILEKMEANKLDLGVVLEPFSSEQYYTKRAIESEVVLVVSERHPLAKRSAVSFSELAHEKFLMMSKDFLFRGIMTDYCMQAGFEPTVIFESSQWDLIYEMAIDNRGVAFFPKVLMDKYLRKEARYLRLRHPDAPWTLCVAYRKDRYITASMRCFLDLCNPKNEK